MARFPQAAFVAPVLLVCSAHAQVERGGEPLRSAAARGDVVEIKRLVAGRTPLDARDSSGQTALLLAVAGGHSDVARALIEAGADINARAANKDTPWLLAGALGRADMLQAMIPRKPDLRIRNRFGGNALIPACERGHVEAARVLLGTVIDVDHVNDLGWTCLLEIVVLGNGSARHIEVARLVLDKGADPNIADREGVSPLTHAKRRGQDAIARMIEAKGGR